MDFLSEVFIFIFSVKTPDTPGLFDRILWWSYILVNKFPGYQDQPN